MCILMRIMHEVLGMKSIDLRKLTHAVAVADTLSYTRASENLHLTQSALTRSIQALEAELGIQLFDRGKSGVRTTIDGEKVLAKARFLLLQARTLEREVNLLKLAESDEIAFGIGPAMPCLFLPELLATLCDKHPGLRIDVAIESGHRLLEMLREEEIEFFVADTNQLTRLERGLFSTEPLIEIGAGFFAHCNHPLMLKGSVSLEDLVEYPLVSPQYRKEFDLHQSLWGAHQNVKQIHCNDLNALRLMALRANAIIIGIPQMVREEISSGLFCKLPVVGLGSEPVCKVEQVYLAGRTPSMAAARISAEIHRLLIPKRDVASVSS